MNVQNVEGSVHLLGIATNFRTMVTESLLHNERKVAEDQDTSELTDVTPHEKPPVHCAIIKTCKIIVQLFWWISLPESYMTDNSL